jgi:hypothetical protein
LRSKDPEVEMANDANLRAEWKAQLEHCVRIKNSPYRLPRRGGHQWQSGACSSIVL